MVLLSTRWLLTFSIAFAFQMRIRLATGSIYSFCSKGLSFTFSTEACPGGILFKRPLKIDEPCHCFESDLKIYSQCGVGTQVKKQKTTSGCELPLISSEEKWDGRAMLLIPTDTNASKRIQNEPCHRMPDHCVSSSQRITVLKPPILERYFPSVQQVTETPTAPISSSTEGEEGSGDDYYSDESEEEESYSEEETSTAISTKVNQSTQVNTGIINQQHKINVKVVNPTVKASVPTVSNKDKIKLTIRDSIVPRNNEIKTRVINGMRKAGKYFNGKLTYDPQSSEILFGRSFGSSRSLASDKNKIKGRNDGLNALLQENKAALRHIAGVKSGRIPNPPPNTMTFKMIKKSVQIASRVIPNKLMKDIHLEEAYLAFSYLFTKADEDINTDKNLNHEDYISIMLALDNCLNNVYELSFKTSGRPRQVKQFYRLKENDYDVIDPQIPADRTHQIDNEDYIVGIMWKVIDVTHAACFNEFKLTSPSTQFDYLISIENVFQRPEVQHRWYQPQLFNSDTERKFELISHPDIKILMENLDKVDAAIHNVSGFNDFLKKPKGAIENGSVKDSSSQSSKADSVNSNDSGKSRSTSVPKSSIPKGNSDNTLLKRSSQPSPASTTENAKETNDPQASDKAPSEETSGEGGSSSSESNKNTRKKRLVEPAKTHGQGRKKRQTKRYDPLDFEIWGGKAYCLQKADPSLPANIYNSVPSIKNLCTSIVKPK